MPGPLSVVVPALNEAAYLGATLDAARAAFASLPPGHGVSAEFMVVDNCSSDDTAEVARAHGARVVTQAGRGVARARNAGARTASGSMLVFLDADTIVPAGFAMSIAECARDPGCLGGAFDTHYRPARAAVRVYLTLWRWLGLSLGMAQGAAQFCRREVFQQLGGYDERLYMGEDVDFWWRLKRLARKRGGRAVFVRDVRVLPSSRRFDRWPLWKTLLWTNPLVVLLLRRRQVAWRGWYEAPPR